MMLFSNGDTITCKDCPPYILSKEEDETIIERENKRVLLMKMVSALEKKWILSKLKESNWNKAKAAEHLGLTRKMLANRIAKYKIKLPDK